MKQLLTLRNVVKLGCFVLALVAFFFMFGNQLQWGNTQLKFNKALIEDGGSILSFVGYILILVGALISCLSVLTKGSDTLKRYIVLGSAIIMVLGAVFVFCVAAVYNNNHEYSNGWKPTAFPIVAGILAILSGLGFGASEFLPDKELVK